MIAAGLAFSTLSHAACDKGATTVFSCVSKQGKRIQVCDAGKVIAYSFGHPNAKPEIVVLAPREQASTYQWRGVGRAIHYSIEVPNGDTTYRVFWSLDRLSETHRIDAGVEVEVGRKHVATVQCAEGKPILQKIEGIQLKPAD